MVIRSFNPNGVRAFKEHLDDVRSGTTTSAPVDLLEMDSLSAVIPGEILVPDWAFPTRFSLGRALYDLFSKPGLRSYHDQAGVYSWLSAKFFDELCPDTGTGRKPGEAARWILEEDDFRRYYRHLLAGPERIYRTHADDPQVTMAVLAQPPHRPGDLAEQLSARQERISNRTVMAVATQLYVSNGTIRRGAAGKGAGSARRLANVLDQLDLTWDLYDLDPDGLLKLLPSEFDSFR